MKGEKVMKGEKEEMSRMSKKRKSIKSFSIAGLFIMVAVALFTMTGCSDDKATSFTNPVAETFEPKGTIQGIVRDAVTLEPLVGAKVSVGLGQDATTDTAGHFVIKDVPATTDALNGSVAGVYQVSVDLGNVTSPVKMADTATTIKYPAIAYRTVSVSYTSLNDSSPCPDDGTVGGATNNTGITNCGTNATNHDTPVEGLVGSIMIGIGKLDANITGVVAGCAVPDPGDFFTPVGDGYTVQLFTAASSGDTGSGAAGHLLDTATTDADGEFSFSNVEANLPITITARSADGTKTVTVANVAPADGRTLDLTNIQASVALHACSTDIHGPEIVEVSPEPGTDLSSGNITVDFSFSEPVEQTPFTSTDESGVGNLYDDIEVFFAGTKAGNVKYSLAWNTAFDKLTVSIPNTGISSLYYVRIKNVNTILADAEGNAVGMGLCPDESDAPAAYGIPADPASNDCTVWFSTKGSTTPAKPTVTLVNASAIDEATTTGHDAVFDWTITSGAKDYNVYCRQVQIWGTTEQAHTYSSGAGLTVTGSSATVDFDTFIDGVAGGPAFVENSEIKLGYDCQVAGVSADGVEGDRSDAVRVVDAVGPLLAENAPTGGGALVCGTGNIVGGLPTGIGAVCDDAANPNNINKIILGYNEEIDEILAETGGNYVFSGLVTGGTVVISTATAPIYNPTTDMVLLTLSDTLTPTEVAATVVRTGANGIRNTTATGADDTYIAVSGGITTDVDSNDGAIPNTTGLCVAEGPDGALDSVVGTTDDVIFGTKIYAGANGTCEVTANNSPAGATADDIQVVAVSSRSGVCGIEAAGGAPADVVEAATDEDTTGAGGGLITTGSDGTCETTAAAYSTGPVPAGTIIITPGNSTPNSVAISAGGDGDLDVTTLNNGAGCPTGCEDAPDGTIITVSGVKDVAGNTIRAAGDVFRSDGNTE